MLKGVTGFKDFVLRGNVVDLAIAVVIGAAFTAVVNAFAADFLTPLIGLIGGGGKLGGQLTIADQHFRWGAFISQVITFVLTAAIVYFLIVLPMHTFMERRRRGEEPGPVQPTQIELLVEIRDLLRAQQAAPAAHGLAWATATAPPDGAPRQPATVAPPTAASPAVALPIVAPSAPAAQPPVRPLPPVPPRRRD